MYLSVQVGANIGGNAKECFDWNVFGNHISDTEGTGIYLAGSTASTTLKAVTVRDNHIDTAEYGIILGWSGATSFLNDIDLIFNQIRLIDTYGIYLNFDDGTIT
ncbi:unnamed protein product, partial [marine sediment metagenome]